MQTGIQAPLSYRQIMFFKKKNKKTSSLEATSIHRMWDEDGLRIATIVDDNDWVKAKAREVDLDKELHVAKDLDRIMRHMRDMYKFVGVSSNNIYWNLTQTPIRQILIPTTERKYISVINPEILKLEGQDNNYVEACGSIPNKVYIVRRKPYVLISGYTIEKERIELEYGSKDFYSGEDPIYSSYSNPEWVIQHEMDHLDGITIQDKGAALV
ncbi:MAG: peptide deformylase [Syntrophales bacterium]